MRNISQKPDTLRTAVATATLNMPASAMRLLRERKVEKGDALEIGRAAGFLAAKRTWDLLPLCHQLPLTGIDIQYALTDTALSITVAVETVSATGVEMEALTAASITALTVYDLLKPHAGNTMQITDVRLLEKSGGKTDYSRALSPTAPAVILVPSDAILAGRKSATAVKATEVALAKAGFEIIATELLPSASAVLQERLRFWQAQSPALIITVGGTGLSAKDQTVTAIRPLLSKELPGFMEAARNYGQRRTPYAALSGGIAGLIDQTLVITLPGSTQGATESLAATISAIVRAVDGLRRPE